MKLRKFEIVLIFFIIFSFLYISSNIIRDGCFGYDEADYMSAVSRGFVANYWDQGTISIVTFLQKGSSEGMARKKSELSKFIRESNDISFLRHYHGPLYFYLLTLIKKITGENEYYIRLASFLCSILGTIAILLACRTFIQFDSQALILYGSLLLFSPTLMATGALITPHSLFAAISLINLLLLAQFLKTRKLTYYYLTIIFLALAFLTIEYAPLILMTILISVLWQRKILFDQWTIKQVFLFIAKSIGVFLLTILVLWPGGLLKLTLLKNYLWHGYVTIMLPQNYGTANLSDLWLRRFIESPVDYTLIILFLIYYLYLGLRNKVDKYFMPFVFYIFLIFLCTLRNRSGSFTYMATLMPAAYLIIVFMIGIFIQNNFQRTWTKNLFVILIILATIGNSIYFFRYSTFNEKNHNQDKYTAVVKYFQKHHVSRQNLLVHWSFVPTLHYYFPIWKLDKYMGNTPDKIILEKLKMGNYDGLIYIGAEINLTNYLNGIPYKMKIDQIYLIKNQGTSDKPILYLSNAN